MRTSRALSLAALIGWAGLAIAQPSGPPDSVPPPRPAPVLDVPGGAVPAPAAPATAPSAPFGSGGQPDAACAPFAPTCCAPGAFGNRFWVDADFLLWWTKSNNLPPLLTTGSPTDLIPGALGQSGTSVLYGGTINDPTRTGGRFTAGWWWTENHTIGLDGSFLFLDSFTKKFSTSSTTSVLAEPFFDANTGAALAYGLAYPGVRAGAFGAALNSRFWGADANLRSALIENSHTQLSLLGGFRYLNLHETLDTADDTSFVPVRFSRQVLEIQSSNRFRTTNDFYGGQLGADLRLAFGRFTLGFLGKVALGVNHETASIFGGTTATLGGNPLTSQPYGTLTWPTNVGSYSRDIFAVAPEATFTLGYWVTDHIRLSAGYTFLYLSNVIRPGDAIDQTINTTQVRALGQGPLFGPARPTFNPNPSDYWAQGLNFGVELRY